MRNPILPTLEMARITNSGSEYDTKPGSGPDGAYHILIKPKNALVVPDPRNALRIIANAACADSHWWEHVSVSLLYRTPTWEEMCFVKYLFWESYETVIQFHPPEKQYVNHHPNCPHLWRNVKSDVVLPPAHLVGPKG